MLMMSRQSDWNISLHKLMMSCQSGWKTGLHTLMSCQPGWNTGLHTPMMSCQSSWKTGLHTLSHSTTHKVPLIRFWPSDLKSESTNKVKDLAQKKLTITFSKRWCPINPDATVSCKLSRKYISFKVNRMQTIYSTPFFKTCVCDVTHALAGYGIIMCCVAWNWAHF